MFFCRIGRNIATIVELALPDFQFYKFNLEIKEGFENLLQQPLNILYSEMPTLGDSRYTFHYRKS